MSEASKAWHPTREEALLAPLDRLTSHWVQIQCDCGRIVHFPGKMLLKQCGPIPLKDALRRLRCSQCRVRPTRLSLTDDPTGGVGGKVAWSVDLA